MTIINESVQDYIIIPIFNIDKITLLTSDKAKRVPQNILSIGKEWWLRDKGVVAWCIKTVDKDGKILVGGRFDNDRAEARPVLKIKDFDFSKFKVGDKVYCLGIPWYYIGKDSILLKDSLGDCRFNNTPYKTTNFNYSSINTSLKNWLANRLSTTWPFILNFDDSEYYCESSKESVLYKINELINSGFAGKITITNQKTGVIKEIYI